MNTGLKYTLITLAVLGSAVGIYFLVKPKDDDDDNGTDDLLSNLNPFTPSNKYKSDSFPLKKDSGGSRVRKLQEYLNTKYSAGLTVDGKFGPLTEGALKTHTSLTQVDETWYNNNVLATSSGNGNGNGNGNDDDDNDNANGNQSFNLNLNPNAYDNLNSIYAQNLNPIPVDNTYVATPNINLNTYGFDGGQNENIVISGNTITNTDETSPAFTNSGLFMDCDSM